MMNITALQQKYLEQFIKRKSQPIFKQNKQNLLGEEQWSLLLHEVVPKELSLKCEFPNEKGHPCNSNIRNIYTIQSASGKLLKVGSTCLEKVVPLKEINQIEKQAEKLKETMMKVNQTYGSIAKKIFTAEEKSELLEKAAQEGILSADVRVLLQEGVPLPEGMFTRIHSDLFNLEQNRKQLEEKRRKAREKEKLWQEAVQQRKVQLAVEKKKVVISSIRSKNEELKARMEEAGLTSIQTIGDAKKAAEVGVLTHCMYAPPRKLNFWRYSDVVSEVMAHFDVQADKRQFFIEKTIEHAKEVLRGKGYNVFKESEDNFLFTNKS